MEKGECNLDTFVRSRIGAGAPATSARSFGLGSRGDRLLEATSALRRWEQGIQWLHSHGVLHLDIKAENAVCFGDGAVKLIDLSGMLTRRHVPSAPEGTPNADLRWHSADLMRLNVPCVNTEKYMQPEERGPGRALIDYSADWWSAGVSKLETLGLGPAYFAEGADTPALVLEGLGSGGLEAAVRGGLAALLAEEDHSSDMVSAWVASVMDNLNGHRSQVESAPFLDCFQFFFPFTRAWLGKGAGRALVTIFGPRRPKKCNKSRFPGATCIVSKCFPRTTSRGRKRGSDGQCFGQFRPA